MIINSDVYTRRILNFPAIRPCESAPPSTLLASLIHLGQIICGFKNATFFTNKRNATNLIRLIGNILVFLEDSRYRSPRFSDSVRLSLSELHFVFQKILLLLEDCSRGDSRLWVLMNSERVSGQFRVLSRAIAVALDVLPSDGGDEVWEVVELVRKQAMKLKFEVEVKDRRIMEDVNRILGRFGSGYAPESGDLVWDMEHLGIRSWSECHKEVKFLEAEIGLEWETGEKKNLVFLSGLLGFMVYCRCTLFDDAHIVDRNVDGGCSQEMKLGLNSDDFRCPITLELMSDPVTIETGHTYDRASILKWFRSGNPTCPKTGEKLSSTNLVPNVALKRLIKQHCIENGVKFGESGARNRDVMKTIGAGSAVAEQAMKLLGTFLVAEMVVGTSNEQNKAAREVRLLTKTSVFNRSCLVEAGVIPPILSLLSSGDPSGQENAIASLLNICKYSTSKRIVVENGGLELILGVLKEGTKIEARQHAAGALFYLASIEEYRKLIGEIPGAIPALMELIKTGNDRGKKNALVTIFGLLVYPDNHWRVLGAGLVPVLVSSMRSFEREDLVTESLAVLSTLAEKVDGTRAILSVGALPTILDAFSTSNSRTTKEYCVSLILALCINGERDVVPILVNNPSLMALLYAQLTEGTPRASKKAGLLIRILHEFNEKRSSGLINPAISSDQFIHVW